VISFKEKKLSSLLLEAFRLKEIEFDIKDIVQTNLQDIPETCSGCVYWEFPEEFDKAKAERMESQRRLEFEQKKREWFVRTMKDFGTCGKIVYYESKPVAYAQYAPAESLPNIRHYESQPVGKLEEGTVFLSCLYIADRTLRGKGLGETLLRNIIDDLKRRGFKSVETFARRGNPENPSGPIEFFIKNGFIIKDKANPEFPLMRLYL
jgi:ribosomal protein S18 acetylase RimI-like enzyme